MKWSGGINWAPAINVGGHFELLQFRHQTLSWPDLYLKVIEACNTLLCFPDGSVVKDLHAIAGDTGDAGSIPGSGRSPRGGNGNLLQYSCLKNPMDWEAWQATVHRVAKSWTWLSDWAKGKWLNHIWHFKIFFFQYPYLCTSERVEHPCIQSETIEDVKVYVTQAKHILLAQS